ncbi:hypothetical protein EUGRSUZ_G01881 [Eucalyptus grandis]|uniref:Uncharacterized protein n=2 Tax=Eucalyptus grandis TaxID=71139 RepID=A0ACC3K5I0_EUCGR|nr:hypothetical protein EUGRSUZ_G01881 [Eucalyptus grandis]
MQGQAIHAIMMSSKITLHFLLLTFASFLLSSTGRVHGEAARPCTIDAIYQFGDSTSDTNNLIRIRGPNALAPRLLISLMARLSASPPVTSLMAAS